MSASSLFVSWRQRLRAVFLLVDRYKIVFIWLDGMRVKDKETMNIIGNAKMSVKLIGAFVISCLNNGLILLGAQATESNIYLGLAILAAMIINVQLDAVRVKRKR